MMNVLAKLKKNMEDKCSKEETISIVREEIDKRMSSRDNIPAAAEGTDKPEGGTDVNVVLAEMNERKQREPNIIIYGQEECNSADRETRAKHDQKIAIEVSEACSTTITEEDIVKTMRLGKFDKEKEESTRPLLIQFKDKETKSKIFKNIKKTANNKKKIEETSISNDLTVAERENEKVLKGKAKDLTEAEQSGDFVYRVRGPPGPEE